jgi:CheY-like chemotaxis protein
MSQTYRHRILLVEDDPDSREVIAMLLISQGYDVSTAENGLAALSQLNREVPDIIISDLNMPEMSGFELLSLVHSRWPSVPVIAMSASYDSGDRLPNGVMADAFFAKGKSQFEELFNKIDELIRTSVAPGINRVDGISGSVGV